MALTACSVLSITMPLKDFLRLLYFIQFLPVLNFVLLRQIEIRHIHFAFNF